MRLLGWSRVWVDGCNIHLDGETTTGPRVGNEKAKPSTHRTSFGIDPRCIYSAARDSDMTSDRPLSITTATVGPLTTRLLVEGTLPIVESLGQVSLNGPSGVLLAATSNDLHANFVVLEAGDTIAAHTNEKVDVLIVVVSGTGELGVDGISHRLEADVLAIVPAGCEREIIATSRLLYHSIHSSVRSSASEE